MGQYHMPANLDRYEYLHPHHCGDGLKLMEFGLSARGTMTCLAVLLAASNRGGARGGGDLHDWRDDPYGDGRNAPEGPTDPELLMKHIVGRWAGDRIAIIGDYFKEGDVHDLSVEEMAALWNDDAPWKNISALALEAARLDQLGAQIGAEPWAEPTPAYLADDGTIQEGSIR